MAENTFLDPDAISRGEALGLMARRVVEGYRVGEHRSPFKGFAIEFAQHREYTAGDDIRHLDWKVLGRSDRYYIKQYEQDTNYVANVVLDGSASMNYGSGKVTKLHFSKALAACLSYLVLVQRDAVALGIVDTEAREYLPRTDNLGKIHHIMNRLAAFEANNQTQLGTAVEQITHRAKSRGIFILISDLMDDDEGFFKALQRLNLSGHEVIVFHVLDPYELTFPFQGTWRLLGLEDTTQLQTTPADIRKSYLEKFNEHCRNMRSTCEKFNTHYVLADTGKSLAEVMSGYLAFRRMVGRK